MVNLHRPTTAGEMAEYRNPSATAYPHGRPNGRDTSATVSQGLALVHVRAQLEQALGHILELSWVIRWTEELKLS